MFHYMGPILRFVGVQDMLHWAMFFFLVRLGCYTLLGFLPSPWMVSPTHRQTFFSCEETSNLVAQELVPNVRGP